MGANKSSGPDWTPPLEYNAVPPADAPAAVWDEPAWRSARVEGAELDVSRLVEVLAEVRAAEKVPGISAAVSVAGVETTVVIGYADRAAEVPVEPTDRFRLSSLAKPFTATAVLLLANEGRVDLSAPAARYLDDLVVDPAVTVRHLLTHTSGLDRPGFYHLDEGYPIPTLPKFYGIGPLITTFEPGTEMRYSNHNYAVLGQLAEDVTRTPFEEVIRVLVTSPVGAEDVQWGEGSPTTGFMPSEDSTAGAEDRIVVAPVIHPILTPASGGWTTAQDLVRLGSAIAGVVPTLPASVRVLLTTNALAAPLPPRGLGLILLSVAGEPVAGHTGGWPGFSGALAIAPARGLAVAALLNKSAEARGALGQRMLESLFG